MSGYDLKFDENSLIPVIIQDYDNNEVLTLGYMDINAFNKSIETGYVHYYSRSKERIRIKGEVSGNTQEIKNIMIDCDNDSLLIKVIQKGNACHLGNKSCFRNLDEKINKNYIDYSLEVLLNLEDLIYKTKENPRENSYTTYLFNSGEENIRKKVGEEAVETILAKTNDRIIYETSDLLYHLLVYLSYNNIKIYDIMNELNKRKK